MKKTFVALALVAASALASAGTVVDGFGAPVVDGFGVQVQDGFGSVAAGMATVPAVKVAGAVRGAPGSSVVLDGFGAVVTDGFGAPVLDGKGVTF